MTEVLIKAAKRLIDSVEFDVNGTHGKGGNGGLTSDESLRAAGELRVIISKMESAADDPAEIFMKDVAAELHRARAIFPGDRIMTIALAEEFGELAKAMLDEDAASVWKEAVQTAVMAARVAIDGDSSVDEWRAAKGLDNHRMGRSAK